MDAVALSLLAPWGNFYVIVGSAAAALTGLQFVVIVLGAQLAGAATASTTRAFGTPTIVHFCTALLIAATLSAPWSVLSRVGLVLAGVGTAGVAYAVVVIRHTRGQTDYIPVLEDWIWHCALPLAAYGALLVAAILLRWRAAASLFVIAAAALLLLFIGIHNAWDAVTYIAIARRRLPTPGSRDE